MIGENELIHVHFKTLALGTTYFRLGFAKFELHLIKSKVRRNDNPNFYMLRA